MDSQIFLEALPRIKTGTCGLPAVGLFKYDGYHYTIYKNNPSDSNSLSSTSLETVYADSKGFIWVGTGSSGAGHWILQRENLLTSNKADDPGSISDDVVKLILEDHEGVIWIGTGDAGLDKYGSQTGKFQHYRHNDSDLTSISCNKVRALYEDKSGVLWVKTGSAWEVGREAKLMKEVLAAWIKRPKFYSLCMIPKTRIALSIIK